LTFAQVSNLELNRMTIKVVKTQPPMFGFRAMLGKSITASDANYWSQ